jgi:hypothetical protein
LQTVIFAGSASKGIQSESDDPMLHFAFSLASVTSQSDFRQLVDRFSGFPIFTLKGAQILWNCFVAFGNNSQSLTPFDLSQIREIPPDLYIEKLPERFTDLFLGQSAADILALANGGAVCRCLTCGTTVRLPFARHVGAQSQIACDGATFLMIVGKYATCFVFRNHVAPGFRIGPPLYVGEHGDASIGFALGCPLFLSRQQRDEGIKRMITKREFTGAMRTISLV